MITPHHIEQTHQFMAALAATCRDRRLPLPAIREVQLAQRHGRTFSFAIFPEAVGGKLEAYQQAGFLHQLSTTLKGQPVTYSNHTGFRLVAVIEDVREALPERLDAPEHLPDCVRLGRDDANQEITISVVAVRARPDRRHDGQRQIVGLARHRRLRLAR